MPRSSSSPARRRRRSIAAAISGLAIGVAGVGAAALPAVADPAGGGDIPPAALDRPGFFNASFPGAAPEEMLDFVERHVGAGEAVLLGLDFFMFNEREVPLRPEGLPDTTSLPALERRTVVATFVSIVLLGRGTARCPAPPATLPQGRAPPVIGGR